PGGCAGPDRCEPCAERGASEDRAWALAPKRATLRSSSTSAAAHGLAARPVSTRPIPGIPLSHRTMYRPRLSRVPALAVLPRKGKSTAWIIAFVMAGIATAAVLGAATAHAAPASIDGHVTERLGLRRFSLQRLHASTSLGARVIALELDGRPVHARLTPA